MIEGQWCNLPYEEANHQGVFQVGSDGENW